MCYDGEKCVLLLCPCKVAFVKSSHILTIISTGCREPLIEGPKGELPTDVYFAPYYRKQDTINSILRELKIIRSRYGLYNLKSYSYVASTGLYTPDTLL